jgi:hypothetical protein
MVRHQRELAPFRLHRQRMLLCTSPLDVLARISVSFPKDRTRTSSIKSASIGSGAVRTRVCLRSVHVQPLPVPSTMNCRLPSDQQNKASASNPRAPAGMNTSGVTPELDALPVFRSCSDPQPSAIKTASAALGITFVLLSRNIVECHLLGQNLAAAPGDSSSQSLRGICPYTAASPLESLASRQDGKRARDRGRSPSLDTCRDPEATDAYLRTRR